MSDDEEGNCWPDESVEKSLVHEGVVNVSRERAWAIARIKLAVTDFLNYVTVGTLIV